jgi:hypothetical protein
MRAERTLKSAGTWIAAFLFSLLASPTGLRGQSWTWTNETADTAGRFTSLAVDKDRNVHVAYAGEGGSVLKYAFRSAESGKWFTMELDKQLQDFATNLALGPRGNPRICYTPRELRYAEWTGEKWNIQTVAPGSGSVEYNCTVTIGSDGVPHLTWYHTRSADGANFLHIKYAILQDGAWMARTVDFEGEDGKWNSMVIDAHGSPQLLYSVFPRGELKYAVWDGKEWQIALAALPNGAAFVDMGTSLVLNDRNQPEFSYYETSLEYAGGSTGSLKFASRKGNGWDVQTVDAVRQRGSWVGFRSSLVLDKAGFPHISYEDAGTLKHAYWDGKRWRIQVVANRANEPYLYSAMARDQDDNLYISYRDPSDGSLKLAIGHRTGGDAQTTALQPNEKN